jgi:hypothetical protein
LSKTQYPNAIEVDGPVSVDRDIARKRAIFKVLSAMTQMSASIVVEPQKGAHHDKLRSLAVYHEKLSTPLPFIFVWSKPMRHYVGYLYDNGVRGKAVVNLATERDAMQFAAAFFGLEHLRANKKKSPKAKAG